MACGCGDTGCAKKDDGWWTVLLWAFGINAGFFLLETAGALRSGSSALLADAMDFLGDSLNYGASLLVVGMAAAWASRVAFVKGAVMAGWGVAVLARAGWMLHAGVVPEASTMTMLSILALIANLAVAGMLFRHRQGDANRRSVWLCARNDAIGNLAVLVAAQGVAATGRAWPDLAAAGLLAGLGIVSGISVMRSARAELA